MNINRHTRSVKTGEIGQELGERLLNLRGFRMVEKIETGWKVQRDRRGRVLEAWPVDKVSGDVRAVSHDGKSVLAECKVRDNVLRFSDLKPHQRQALDEHSRLSEHTFVVWITSSDVLLLRWPIEGFVKGTSLDVLRARALDVSTHYFGD